MFCKDLNTSSTTVSQYIIDVFLIVCKHCREIQYIRLWPHRQYLVGSINLLLVVFFTGFFNNKNYCILPILSLNICDMCVGYFCSMKKGVVYLSQSNISVSGPKLRCCIGTEHFQMMPSIDVWSTDSKSLIYNINSATPCCELNRSQKLSFETPQDLCPSICDPSAAGETLQQACHQTHWHQSVLHVAVWHNTAGVALWPGGKSASMAVAALALITHTPTHYSSPWGDADRGTRVSVWSGSFSQGGGGGHTRQWKKLFTDGPLKKPTAAKQCSRWAVWGVEAIMSFNCLHYGRWFESMWSTNKFFSFHYVQILFQGGIRWHYSFFLRCHCGCMSFTSSAFSGNCNNCSRNGNKQRDETVSETRTRCHSSLSLFLPLLYI